MIQMLKDRLAITLSATVQSLGPMPDEVGERVKTILSGTDDCALLALGCYMDDARKAKDYTILEKGVGKIPPFRAEDS